MSFFLENLHWNLEFLKWFQFKVLLLRIWPTLAFFLIVCWHFGNFTPTFKKQSAQFFPPNHDRQHSVKNCQQSSIFSSKSSTSHFLEEKFTWKVFGNFGNEARYEYFIWALVIFPGFSRQKLRFIRHDFKSVLQGYSETCKMTRRWILTELS